MKNILIPTDFSKNALHALQYVQELHKRERIHCFLLHTYAEEVYRDHWKATSEKIEEVKKEKKEHAEKKLDQLLQTITNHAPNPLHHFETVALLNKLVDGVNALVNEKNIDLVVMGTKGETSNHKTTFGSYTLEVFKYVRCPVLAIPEACRCEPPKTILFPTDYTLTYQQRELKLLGDVAGESKAEIHCLYITDSKPLSPKQKENKLFLKETLPQACLFFETTPTKNKAETIVNCIEEHKAGMLVMVNERRSFFENMLYGSTLDVLGLQIKTPFLVMQNLYR